MWRHLFISLFVIIPFLQVHVGHGDLVSQVTDSSVFLQQCEGVHVPN